MFDKLSAIKKAKKMQDDMKKQMEQIFHNEERGGNTVLVRGDKRIEKLIIDGEERKDVKDLLNSAIKEIDKKVEKKMRDQAGDVMSMLGL